MEGGGTKKHQERDKDNNRGANRTIKRDEGSGDADGQKLPEGHGASQNINSAQHERTSKQEHGALPGDSDVEALHKTDEVPKEPPSHSSKLRHALEIEIAQKKKVIRSVNLSNLPDKGQRLKQQLNYLETQLSALSISKDVQQQGSSTAPEGDKKPQQPGPLSKTKPSIEHPLKPSSAPKQIQPVRLRDAPVERLETSPYWSIYEKGVKQVSPQPLKRIEANVARPNFMTTLGGRAVHLRDGLDEQHLKDFATSLQGCPGGDQEFAQPEGVKTPLLPHQRQGLAWMLWRETQAPPGGILADGMGLGKTLTMLALIQQQRRASREGKRKGTPAPPNGEESTQAVECSGTLVVCPLSLLHQWEGEVTAHLSEPWSVHLYHGKGRGLRHDELLRYDLVITTYDTLSNEWARATAARMGVAPLFHLCWERVVLDEAHCVRNPNTKRAKAACALRARHHWAVSGTPVHNNIVDVRSLLKFLHCVPFDDDAFWKMWTKNHPGPESLSPVVKCLLLRRTKDQKGHDDKPLVPLPEKTVVLHRLELEGIEWDIYRDLYEWSRSSGVEKYVDPVTKRELYKNTGPRMFVMLIRLQQACSHLSLLKKKALDEAAVDDVDDILADSMANMTLSDELSSTAAAADRLDAIGLQKYEGRVEFERAFVSCKIKALLDMLGKVMTDSNDKCVVVSKWTSMLGLVQEHLERSHYRCLLIQGNVSAAKRADHVRNFNQDKDGPRILLLSLEAGGVGLNLIGGNHMFVLDVHWNPALELQAFDRIHRVGQKKPVTINRFVCVGTIEERILELQQQKERLAESVVGKRKITKEDYNFLFGAKASR